MNNSNLKTVFTILLLVCFSSLSAQDILRSSKGKWEVEVAHNGTIKSLKMDFAGEKVSIPWHSEGDYAGPTFNGQKNGESFSKTEAFTYERKAADLSHAITYLEENGNLTIQVSIKNNTDKVYMIEDEASFRLGIDHVMSDPEKYFDTFFPTLLRCEKTHLWGYFQAPNGKVLAIASPDPVASWHIDYIGTGHRIATSELDLLHKLPLPERHPQEQFSLAPNEEKKWTIVLLPLSDISEVPATISSACKVPMIALERTTASAGEIADFNVFSTGESEPVVSIYNPLGKEVSFTMVKKHAGTYSYEFKIPELSGTYQIKAEIDGLQSSASIYVRKPWSWYLNQARNEALRMDQKSARHREAWMGFFSAYWAEVYSPDAKRLEETELKFSKFWNDMINPKTGFYYTNKKTWHTRPQNTSWMVAVLVARYAATKDVEHLKLAADWGDFLIDKFQLPNGAYKGYTALTLGAKFLQELMWYEAPLAENSEYWKKRYDKHNSSVQAAAKNILMVKDMGDTEGESTYEDSQAGSAWSLLAMHALLEPAGADYKDFVKESLAIQKRHESLTQALIPDSRMRGGTLRWWETQYDVLIHKNMMNSPHAWTMRSQFGALYLYLLTGKEYFLNVAVNAMGTCSQAIDHNTGILHWAFVPDPYIEAERFVPDYRKSGEGKYINEVIGEQWLPMISDWWIVPENNVAGSNEKGWSCDNDVHEHFRFLSEQFIPNAFVLERENGTIRTWNCVVNKEGNNLIVTPAEEAVTRVHFNLNKKHTVKINFTGGQQETTVNKGMQWIGPGMKDYKIPAIYLWNEMISAK